MDADVNISQSMLKTKDGHNTGLQEAETYKEIAAKSSDCSCSSIDSQCKNTVNEYDNVLVVEKSSGNETSGKKRKLNIESGRWSCKYATCNIEDDQDMLHCSQCKSNFHYRCTDLPPYQITRFNVPGYRKYHCEGCVDIPKDLPGKCRIDTRKTLDMKQNLNPHGEYNENIESFDTLKREIDEKSKLLVSIQMAYDTQKQLIEDKDELISNQKSIIASLSRCDNDDTEGNSSLSDIISQKNLELELCAKEIENLKSSKADKADIIDTEKKLKDAHEKLREEKECNNTVIK